MLLFSVILQEYSEHASALLKECQSGVEKLDGTCATCKETTCSLMDVQQICGRNSRVSKVSSAGKSYLKCECDFDAGAILAFDGLSCIGLADCFSAGGVPNLQAGSKFASKNGKEVCTCGEYPYDFAEKKCSKIADVTLMCPVNMVMTFAGKCVASDFIWAETTTEVTGTLAIFGQNVVIKKADEGTKKYHSFKTVCKVDPATTNPVKYYIAPNKEGCIATCTHASFLLDTKTGSCNCNAKDGYTVYDSVLATPVCVKNLCTTPTQPFVLKNGMPTCVVSAPRIEGMSCWSGYYLKAVDNTCTAITAATVPITGAILVPDMAGFGGLLEVCKPDFYLPEISPTVCVTRSATAAKAGVYINKLLQAVAAANMVYDSKTVCLDMTYALNPTKDGAVPTCVAANPGKYYVDPFTGGKFATCGSGKIYDLSKNLPQMCVDTVSVKTTGTLGDAQNTVGHIELNYKGTRNAFYIMDNVAGCDQTGFAKNPATGECVSPTKCGLNSVVDTTKKSVYGAETTREIFLCACKAGVTVRYLSAASTIADRTCVDSCANDAETLVAQSPVTYPYKAVYGAFGAEFQCASQRRPEKGFFCPFYPVQMAKRFDGNCVSCSGKCESTEKTDIEAICNAQSTAIETAPVSFEYQDMSYMSLKNFQCKCSGTLIINFDATACIESSTCTTTLKGTEKDIGVGMTIAQKGCTCGDFGVKNAGTCHTTTCTTSDCACPVGMVLTFQGKCVAYDTDDKTICGQGAYAQTQLKLGYYRCKCEAKTPFVFFDKDTDGGILKGCTTECIGGFPASIDVFNNIVCPNPDKATACTTVDTTAKTCLCYFDGGYVNSEGKCKKCASQNGVTPFIDSTKTACKVSCAADEIRAGRDSMQCIKKEECTKSKGTDGKLRVLSLDKLYCIDANECENDHNGVILGQTCVCGQQGELPYVDSGKVKTCVSSTVFPLKSSDFIQKCPGNYFMDFQGRCAPCPETGCYLIESGNNQSVNAITYCGENSQFFYNASGNYYGCECISREKVQYLVNPARFGCLAKCDANTMTLGHVYVQNDACDCALTHAAYVTGKVFCEASCGASAFNAMVINYQLSEFEAVKTTHICQRTCAAETCMCEPGYVLGLSGECKQYGSNVQATSQIMAKKATAEEICGGNTSIITVTAEDGVTTGLKCACEGSGKYVVSFDSSRCLGKEECYNGILGTVLSADQTKCIAAVECGSAISLTGKRCVYQQRFNAPACGDNAHVIGNKCACADGFPMIDAADSSCMASCPEENARTPAVCFKQGLSCTGKDCGCAAGYTLTLSGTCVKNQNQNTGADCGSNSGAILVKSADAYRCECPAGKFLNAAQTQCVETCGADAPWANPFNNMRVCIKSGLTCDDSARCMCDHQAGYAVNSQGLCELCDGGVISSQFICVKNNACDAGEVLLGKLCVQETACKADGYLISVSGRQCIQQCNNTVAKSTGKLIESEVITAEAQCTCAKRYKLSDNGLYCKRNFLNGGEIAGIVIGVVAFIAIIAGIAVFFSMKKSGKCGSKGKKKADKPMNDTITGNNDTAIASGGK